MRDDDHGHPLLPAHILQKFQDRLTGLVIQSARRLVAEKKLGILGKGSCDRNPLLLPAGKLRRKIPEPAFQSHFRQHSGRVQRFPADLKSKLHILKSRQIGNQIVKLKDKTDILPAVAGKLTSGVAGDVPAVHINLPRGGLIHSAEDIQHRGLARAAGAYDHDKFPFGDFKTYPVHRHDLHFSRAVDLGYIFQFYIGFSLSAHKLLLSIRSCFSIF